MSPESFVFFKSCEVVLKPPQQNLEISENDVQKRITKLLRVGQISKAYRVLTGDHHIENSLGSYILIWPTWNYLPRARFRFGSREKPLTVFRFVHLREFNFEVFSRPVIATRYLTEAAK